MAGSFSLSIVSPSYNLGSYIGETIDSIIAQGFETVELVIADGQSTDNTVEVLREYEGRLNLHWFSEPDGGLYDALNKAIARSSGDWIGWLNCDDIYPPGTFAAVAAAAENTDVEVICGDAEIFADDASGDRRSLYVDQHYRGDRFAPTPENLRICHLNACFFRRHLLSSIGTFRTDFRIVSDRDYLFRLMSRAPRSMHLGRVTCQYRSHDASLTMNNVSSELQAPVTDRDSPVAKEMEALCEQHRHNSEVPPAARFWCRTLLARKLVRRAAENFKNLRLLSFLKLAVRGVTMRPRSLLWLAGYLVRRS